MNSLENNKSLHSPIGLLQIFGTCESITSISFADTDLKKSAGVSNPYLDHCAEQLENYFRGTRMDFHLNLHPAGTDFQRKVWDLLLKVQFGTTRTYSWQSKEFGNPLAIRAIAAANGQNKIPIIIPCHRIIGSNGKLTGYAGGIWRKRWLIEHERRVLGMESQLELKI